ncbi:MAG: VCBS repeat-containing protein [Planctomycetota bacterium]
MPRTNSTCSRLAIPLLASILLAARALASPQGFDTWTGYDTGTYATARFPYAQALGDFDGDGDQDVAVANWSSMPRISVIKNHGDGSFAPPALYTAQKMSLDIRAADLDRDGDLDLVVSNTGETWEGRTISVFENLGDGTFPTKTNYTVGLGPIGVAVADFNRDGWPDIAVADYDYLGSGTQVAVLLNDGNGGLLAATFFPAGTGPYKLAAGDLNGDGAPDLVVADDHQKMNVLLNAGMGTFGPPVEYDVPSYWYYVFTFDVALGDVDHDGDLDAFYASLITGYHSPSDPTGGVALFRNRGDGTFTPAEDVTLMGGGANFVKVADVTGDGWLDVVGTHGSERGVWSVTPGNGAGGFAGARQYFAGQVPWAIDAHDMDGDGDADIVLANRDSLEVSVHRNDGSGEFPVNPSYRLYMGGKDLDAGDIDGDGDLDVVVSELDPAYLIGDIAILRNQGDGRFNVTQYPSLIPTPLAWVKLRDLSGDGHLDLLWADDYPPYDFSTAMNHGNGTFDAPVSWQAHTCGNSGIDAFDIDRDGDLDVILLEGLGCGGGSTGNRVFIAKNLGDGTFDPPYIVQATYYMADVAAADFNGDGHLDLALGDLTAEVFLGDGTGRFQPPIQNSLGWGCNFVKAVDVTADGIVDLVTGNIGGHDIPQSMWMLRGRGDGTFAPGQGYLGSYSPELSGTSGVTVGDVDGDSHLDVMVGNFGSHDVSLFRNRGDGSFENQIRYGVGTYARDPFYADFTGDGVGDLVAVTTVGLFFDDAITLVRGRSCAAASWSNYGTGWSGTGGVPAFTSSASPSLCASIALQLENSLHTSTRAVLFVGALKADLPTSWDGHLLLAPVAVFPFALPASGLSLPVAVPCDNSLCGTSILMQVLELDGGASRGVSFTRGLELVVGS